MTALQRSRLLRALAGLSIVVLMLAHDLGWRPFDTLAAVDRQFYDSRQALLTPVPDPRIVIIDVDERSLAEQGRWPWPRERIADLIDAIFRHGAPSVLGFDMLFAEPQLGVAGDARLAQALRNRPTVLGYYLSSDRRGRQSGSLPMPVFDDEAAPGLAASLVHADGYGANIAALGQAAAAQGFFNPFVGAGIDVDGRIRAMPLLAHHEGRIYASFAIAVMRQHLGSGATVAEGDWLRLHGPRGRVDIPVSFGYTAMVPYAGRGGSSGGRFQYLSATDVLTGKVDWSLLHDRIALVGTSAPGLTDLRPTPVSEVYPGVEIHASLIAGALDQRLMRRPAEAGAIAAASTLIIGGALALILPVLGPIGTVLAGMLALMTIAGGNAIAYSNLGLVLPVTASMAAVLLLTAFNLLFGYLAEGRARRAVIRLFGEYVSPALVEQMARDPVRWRMTESTDRELTILFADIRGFTRMAESMDPAALREYLNTVLTGLTAAIHRHGGTVDKYIGDAVMAFWGAPLDDPLHADHAVEAAWSMQEEARRMSVDFVSRGLPPLAIGIGVFTGVVRVGDMGSALRRTYTAIGDAVNLASRIEGLTKILERPILIGETTVAACRGQEFDELAQVDIAGRSDPVRLFVPRNNARAREQSAPYNPGLSQQERAARQQWTGAAAAAERQAAARTAANWPEL